MRFIECDQGTPAWYAARAGLITASCFSTAISMVGALNEQQKAFVDGVLLNGKSESAAATDAGYKAVPKSAIIAAALRGEQTASPSDLAEGYAANVALEIISQEYLGEPIKPWVMERGKAMEVLARRAYEARTLAFVTEAGICVDDNGYGYSSDGLCNDDGLIEIKAPVDGRKIMAMLKTGDVSEYMHQMQGGMWITGRKYCDFIMYVPALKNVGRELYIQRVPRDDAFIDAMVTELARFQKMVKRNVAILSGEA